jgi:LAO/AO transport system kinase
VFAVNKADLGAAARKTASEVRRSAPRQDWRPGWDYPVCLVSATAGTGIAELHEHLERHRRFLVDGDLLGGLRTRHQCTWAVRLLRDEFGSLGVELAGGRAAIERQLHSRPSHQFEAYERLREQLRARFLSVDPPNL